MQDEHINIFVGDIWWQMAQIADVISKKEGQKSENDILILHVSDEHGLITKTTKMPRHIFDKQFSPHTQTPNLFFRRIIIEAIEEEGHSILFQRLDNNGNGLGEIQRIQKRILTDTYFIPQHQMGNSPTNSG